MTRPVIIAHRGASQKARENTVEAFRLARDLGADWVELDVHATADGALAVHHDAALAEGGVIAELAARELPAWLPLLDAALDACEGMGVNVEIKDAPAAAVVTLLAERSGDQPVLVSSFDFETIDSVRALDPAVPTAWLTSRLRDPAAAVARAAGAGHAGLHPFVLTVTEDLVALAHAAGLAVNTWTVDDPDLIAAVAAMGVDGIVTNVPDIALAVL
jgi:glycerophosphoryl diester phosphodiesterase